MVHRAAVPDDLRLYFMLLGRALRQTRTRLFSRDGLIIWGIVFASTASMVLSMGFCSLPLYWVGLFLYPWMLGEVVRGSRLGLSDVKNAFRHAPAVLAAGLIFAFLLLASVLMCAGQFGVGIFLVLLPPVAEILAVGEVKSAADLFNGSMSFLARNFVPWALMNAVVLALAGTLAFAIGLVPAFAGIAIALLGDAFGPDDGSGPVSGFASVAGLFVTLLGFFGAFALTFHPVMMLRAHFFLALGDLTHRTRVFRYRAGSL